MFLTTERDNLSLLRSPHRALDNTLRDLVWDDDRDRDDDKPDDGVASVCTHVFLLSRGFVIQGVIYAKKKENPGGFSLLTYALGKAVSVVHHSMMMW